MENMNHQDEFGYTPKWYMSMGFFSLSIFICIIVMMLIKHPEDENLGLYPFVFVGSLGLAILLFLRAFYLKKRQQG